MRVKVIGEKAENGRSRVLLVPTRRRERWTPEELLVALDTLQDDLRAKIAEKEEESRQRSVERPF